MNVLHLILKSVLVLLVWKTFSDWHLFGKLCVLQTRIVASVYSHIVERSNYKRYVLSWILMPNRKRVLAKPECNLNSARKHSHVHLTYTRTQPRNNNNRFHLQYENPVLLLLLLWALCFPALTINCWYDMMYLLTAIALKAGGSRTVHIYTQTIHRTTQNKKCIEQHKNFGRVRAVFFMTTEL
jgi:hypothetical protein